MDLYGVDGYAIAVVSRDVTLVIVKPKMLIQLLVTIAAQKGIPYDDKTRWRVFKNPKFVDVVSSSVHKIYTLRNLQYAS